MDREIRISPEPGRLEDMFKRLAESGDIPAYNFIIYEQEDYQSSLPVEYIEVLNYKGPKRIATKKFSNPKFKLSKIKRRPNEVVAISSGVEQVKGFTSYMRHLDVDIPLRYEIKDQIRFLKETIDQTYHPTESGEGFIVHSGEGFHIYGYGLMGFYEWVEWIKRARNTKFVEDSWCDIQLKRGFSVLRVTSSDIKKHPPKLLFYYNSK